MHQRRDSLCLSRVSSPSCLEQEGMALQWTMRRVGSKRRAWSFRRGCRQGFDVHLAAYSEDRAIE